MDNIKKSEQTPEDIVTEILKKWLQGTGMPVTWQSLITSLENSAHHMLASTILENIPGKRPSTATLITTLQDTSEY